jgi:hypothetical protein
MTINIQPPKKHDEDDLFTELLNLDGEFQESKDRGYSHYLQKHKELHGSSQTGQAGFLERIVKVFSQHLILTAIAAILVLTTVTTTAAEIIAPEELKPTRILGISKEEKDTQDNLKPMKEKPLPENYEECLEMGGVKKDAYPEECEYKNTNYIREISINEKQKEEDREEEYKKFVEEYYNSLDDKNYEKAYEHSLKNLSFEEFKNLYVDVEDVSIQSIQKLSERTFRATVVLDENGVYTTYQSDILLGIDENNEIYMKSSSIKILEELPKEENQPNDQNSEEKLPSESSDPKNFTDFSYEPFPQFTFKYPKEWKIINTEINENKGNLGGVTHRVTMKKQEPTLVLTFDTALYTDSFEFYCLNKETAYSVHRIKSGAAFHGIYRIHFKPNKSDYPYKYDFLAEGGASNLDNCSSEDLYDKSPYVTSNPGERTSADVNIYLDTYNQDIVREVDQMILTTSDR